MAAPIKLSSVYRAIPALLMWELWRRRNNRRHGKDMGFERILQQTQDVVYKLVKVKYPWIEAPKEWEGIISVLQGYKPKIYYLAMKWDLPEQGWIKCNTDGASRGNPGESSYDFCIRDSYGDLISAEAQQIRIKTSMEAETTAILVAFRKSKGLNLHKIILETDSLSLRMIFSKEWKYPWNIIIQIEDIRQLMANNQCKIKHAFREASQLADKLANIALEQENPLCFNNFLQLPVECRRILNIDKAQITTMRIRMRKINTTYINAQKSSREAKLDS